MKEEVWNSLIENKQWRALAATIIQDNADIIDKSLAEFIFRCYQTHPNLWYCGHSDTDQGDVLLYALHQAFGSWKDILGTITNDEGYFKWGSLDNFNKVCGSGGYSDTKNIYYCLNWLWCCAYNDAVKGVMNNYDSLLPSSFLNEIASVEPEVDFVVRGDYAYAYKSRNYPAIATDDSAACYFFGRSDGMDLKKLGDLYVGIKATKSKFPQAIKCPQPHRLFASKDHSEVYTNTGLIYVPVKNLAQVRQIVSVDTALPRDVLEKYGLPCTDDLSKL